MTPADGVERLFRDQVLQLAGGAPFARSLVNSGRLSMPCVYPSQGHDESVLPRASRPGSVAPDAPQAAGWLLDLLGREPVLLCIGRAAPTGVAVNAVRGELNDFTRARYLGKADGALYLIRPDQIVADRWLSAGADEINAAIKAMWEGRS
jgi:3-(3-hydroxy-phenyl)propionate hydroxylase